MKISKLISEIERKEQLLRNDVPEEKALRSLFLINRMEVQGFIDNGQLNQETEISAALESELTTMLNSKKVTADQVNDFFQKLQTMKTSDDILALSATKMQDMTNVVSMSNNIPNTKKSIASSHKSELTFPQKLDRVRKHLERWAAAEQYATSKEKIGYAGHLKWFKTNMDLYKNNEKDAKAKAVLDAYIAMPGFGAQADKHPFVDLHMELDLLDLEIKGLEERQEDASSKKAEKQQKENELLIELDEEIKGIRLRLKKAVEKDPEIKQYIEPIVKEYITWINNMKKSGTMPKFTVLDGPPGTGKTFFGQTVADVLGIELHTVSMSSEEDVTMVPGRNKGWEDPKPGKCAELQIKSESQLFLWFPDEFEKAEKAVINTHVELLEAGTATYGDKFFGDNKVPKYFTSFIATTNDYSILPSHIKSRAKKILMKGKKPEEKLSLIKKMLDEKIKNNRIFLNKNIIFDPDQDELLLWFLKSYSTQPGLREDKGNIETIVSRMGEYFVENNNQSSLTLTKKFIQDVLTPASARHVEKQRLYGLRIDLSNAISFEKTDNDGNYSNESLPKIIINRNLMRIYTKQLVEILEQDLVDSPENAGLLNEELKDLRGDLKTYQELTIQQIEFLCGNIDNIAGYGLDVKSLLELTSERLTELERVMEKLNRERLQLKSKRPPEPTVSQDAILKLCLEEKTSLEKLRNLLNNAPVIDNEEEAAEKNKNKKTNLQDPKTPNKNTGSVGGHQNKDITFGFNVIQRLTKEAQKTKKPTIALGGKLSSEDFAKICDKEIKKIEKMQKFSAASEDDVRQYTDKQTQQKSQQHKYTADERFEHKLNTIKMYKNLNAVKSQSHSHDTLLIKETNTNGVEETLVNVARDKATGLIKITSENSEPGDKALLEMALFAQRCSKTGVFNIDNCEQNPEAAIKLFLFGRALDLKPHLNTATQNAINNYVNDPNDPQLAGIYQQCTAMNSAGVLEKLESWEQVAGTRTGLYKK